MKTAKQIRARIKEIERDPRYYRGKKNRKLARVFENAPLAVMQIGWESQVDILRWVVTDDPPEEP